MSEALVKEKKVLAANFIYLKLKEENIAREAKPGQFVMVKIAPGWDPLLRRPLAILEVDGSNFSLLFQISGRGTRFLASIEVGTKIEVLGPLGNGFSLPEENKPVLLLAGGRGMVPLTFLARKLVNRQIPVIFFLGVKRQEEIFLTSFLDFVPSLVVACQERSKTFFCGTVIETFSQWLSVHSLPSGSRVYACGPDNMLRALNQLPQLEKILVEVSLEARMGCGFGACLSCAVKRKDQLGYYHVCKDGPVFAREKIAW
ncbi:MAG: dihydroorotate dehydrogenase electron transfer subunit [Candidatus Atribacteria bacterium]|nr:dihydroorotate dehydrogenase electron transfer subunit [Candidatus Atribacteria bacterium]